MIVQSLLDRLIDEAPETAIEPAIDDAAALELYKLSLLRDLENLLNTKQPTFVAHGTRSELRPTLIGYGLPDMSIEDFSSASVRDRLRRQVAETIRLHEPRLTDVQVQADEAPTSRGIRFRILALLTIQRNQELVVYQAKVRPNDKAIALELNG